MKSRLALFLCVLPTCVLADSGPIVADRPGFSTGTYTVKPGKLNTEFGYQYAFNSDGVDQNTQTLPQLNLRMGVSPKAELNLLWDGWNINDADDQSSDSSIADVSVGGKYRLRESDQYNLSLLGSLSLPVGSSPSSSDNVDPLLGLLWDYALGDQVSLFGVLQSSSFKYEGDREYDAQLALGASFSHSARLSTFIEIYGIWPSETQLDDEAVIDAGITLLWNNDVQLDINAGLGLNNASDNFVGVGMAVRF
ncbi:MAG: transporter [Halieaceae bacterium]